MWKRVIMANWQWNKMVKGRQVRTLIVVGCGLFFLFAMMIVLLADDRPKKNLEAKKSVNLTGIIEESFTDAVADNALTAQQTELESLKKQVSELTLNIKSMAEAHQKRIASAKRRIDLSSTRIGFS
ncbi:hypothetical protein PGH45_20030 [Legionella pneumophila]|nr:hypothetical protein [Legionella pneumophila]